MTDKLDKLVKTLFAEQTKFYDKSKSKSKSKTNTNFKKIPFEMAIYSLLYIIHYLEDHNYTLSHICLKDFVIHDNILFLNSAVHLVELKGDYFSYESVGKNGIEFFTKNMENRMHKTNVYESIAYFIYYLLLNKVKNELNENDLSKIFETKPYYFIRNAIQDKCLIYL